MHRTRSSLTAAIVTVIALSAPATAQTVSLSVGGTHGSGRVTDPGLACADGGPGSAWHYGYEAPFGPGVLGQVPGDARLHLDLHRDVSPPGGRSPAGAYLHGTDTRLALATARGVLRLALDAGDCIQPPLSFDGSTASGTGSWEVIDGDGAYDGATGAGDFELTANVDPGVQNPWSLDLSGDVEVRQPELSVRAVDTYWGFLGVHYLVRWVTVVYEVSNEGDGDAFDVMLTGAESPTPGMALVGPIDGNDDLGPVPQRVGDLRPGDSTRILLRWQLPLPADDPPCELVILGCEFDTTLRFDVADALDVVVPTSLDVHAVAPDLPPPL